MNEQWEREWKDYYSILEVDRNADHETIKKSYRRKMAESHPDVSNDGNAEETARILNEAFEILGSEEKKEKYDAAWDKKKEETDFNAQQTNTNDSVNEDDDTKAEGPDISYEDATAGYTEEEKKFAKKIALKEIIEEELEKANLIFDAKNNLLYQGYFGTLDKEEYYESLKELASISDEYIKTLIELLNDADEFDLIKEREKISSVLSTLDYEITNMPLTPAGAKEKLNHEALKPLLQVELEKAKEIMDKYKSTLIYMGRRDISWLEYQEIVTNISVEAKDCASRIQVLLESANKLEIECELTDATTILSKLVARSKTMPDNREAARYFGIQEQLKESTNEQYQEWQKLEIKVQKLINILNKHPNTSRYERLCNAGISWILNMRNDTKKAVDKFERLYEDLVSKSNINPEIGKKMIEEAKSLYQKAEEQHKNAEQFLHEVPYHFDTDDTIGLENLKKFLKSYHTAWDKNLAFEQFREASEFYEKYYYVFEDFTGLKETWEELRKQGDDGAVELLNILTESLKSYTNRNGQTNSTATNSTTTNSTTVNSMNSNNQSLRELEMMKFRNNAAGFIAATLTYTALLNCAYLLTSSEIDAIGFFGFAIFGVVMERVKEKLYTQADSYDDAIQKIKQKKTQGASC